MRANAPYYFVPGLSQWPVLGAVAMFFFILGMSQWVNGAASGPYLFALSMAILIYVLTGWFKHVVGESESGQYSARVDVSFRWSMGWFIFSEVMFFAAFFGALFYMRVLSVPGLGGGDTMQQLWPGFSAQWPVSGPGIDESFTPMGAWGIPAINTLILLTSGATVTWAHWGLIRGSRAQLIWGLVATVALGMLFLGLQAYEYIHAYLELNLTLNMGAYGATFFMLTGFHGLHVTIGTIMLMVILARSIRGHFSADHHFAFEGVSWYWHFVDVVWLLLFVLVYWL